MEWNYPKLPAYNIKELPQIAFLKKKLYVNIFS